MDAPATTATATILANTLAPATTLVPTAADRRCRRRGGSCPPALPGTDPKLLRAWAGNKQIEQLVATPVAGRPRLPESGQVYKSDLFEVRETEGKGWAAFARKEIRDGAHILVERPVLKTTVEGLFQAFWSMSKEDQAQIMGLSRSPIWDRQHPLMGIAKTNGFASNDHEFSMYPIAARFNHACWERANVKYVVNAAEDLIVLTAALGDRCPPVIKPGEELTIPYTNSPSELQGRWGFVCQCGAKACLKAGSLAEWIGQNQWTGVDDGPVGGW